MNIITTFQIAMRSMRSNKVRTGLTVLGVIIGIASVIVVFSAGEGIRGLILQQVESFGTDIIETEIKIPTNKKGMDSEQASAMAIVQGVQVTTLKVEDMEDIKKLPNVKNGYAAIMSQEQASYGNESIKSQIFGASADFIEIDQSEVEFGRFYTDAEDQSQTLVAVLGADIKEKLFANSDPLGKFIKLRNIKFKVIGVMKSRGAVMGLNFDEFIYLPIRTLQKRVMGVDHVLYMVHQLNDISLADETAEEARIILRENHDITASLLNPIGQKRVIGEGQTDTSKDDFRVVTMAESMAVLDTITGAITLLLLAIVAISLLVGGVGITNIMYVIVTERTSEIGLRKAVGAKYKDIIWQFITEAVFITLTGGVFGVIFGVIISAAIAWGAHSYGFDWRFSVPFKAYVVSLSFSAFFGIVFGVYPARKAARMDPIEALRAEN